MTKKEMNILAIVVGVVLMACAIFFIRDESMKTVDGLFIGIGAGLIGMGAANIVSAHIETLSPPLAQQKEIEYQDERNTMIRYRAKAMVGDILQWLVVGIAFISILVNAPVWLTLIVVGVVVIKFVLEMYFNVKYQQEM